MPRPLVSRLLAGLVALAGLVLIVVGTLDATALAPPARTDGRLAGVAGVSVIDTAPGVLALDGPGRPVQVSVSGSGAVFIGVGRAEDVSAYLGTVSRAEITRVSGTGSLTVSRTGTDRALPDPSGVDVWAASSRGSGSATLEWPNLPGQWQLVVAGNGSSAAPQPIRLTWTRAHRDNPAPWLIVGGVVMVLLGAGGLWLTRGRGGHGRRRAGSAVAADPAGADPADADPAEPEAESRAGAGADPDPAEPEAESRAGAGADPGASPGPGADLAEPDGWVQR